MDGLVKREKMKNKRGDLPVTILVIGVFAVCTLALFSFMFISHQINKSFVGVELMEKANLEIEQNSLAYYYDEETKTIPVSFKEGIEFFKEKIIFSVEYNP